MTQQQTIYDITKKYSFHNAVIQGVCRKVDWYQWIGDGIKCHFCDGFGRYYSDKLSWHHYKIRAAYDFCYRCKHNLENTTNSILCSFMCWSHNTIICADVTKMIKLYYIELTFLQQSL